jgi:hypothetical protein
MIKNKLVDRQQFVIYFKSSGKEISIKAWDNSIKVPSYIISFHTYQFMLI